MKRTTLRFLPALAVMLSAGTMLAQSGNIAVNNTGRNPHPSAILDVSSNFPPAAQKGMLIPRMTLAQRTALGLPSALPPGLVVYTTGATPEGFYYVEFNQWNHIDRGASHWDILGNDLTNSANQFFGTRDNVDLNFNTSSTNRMTLRGTPGARYLGIGTPTPTEMVDVNGALRIYQTPAIVPPHQFSATTTTPGVIMFRPPATVLGDSLFATTVPPAPQNLDALMWNGHWAQTGATHWSQATLNANVGTWKKLENDYEERFTKPYTQQGTPTCNPAGQVEIANNIALSAATLTTSLAAFQQTLVSPYPHNGSTRVRHQYMILRSELDVELNQLGGNITANGGLCAGQPITSLAWYVGASATKPTSAFAITIKHVAIGVNNLSTGFDVSVDPAQSCFIQAGVVARPSIVNNWETFVLATPFVWDGIRNVVIEVAYATTNTAPGAGAVKFAPTPGGAQLTASWNSPGAGVGCGDNGPAGSCTVGVSGGGMNWVGCGTNGVNGGTAAFRPVFRFNGAVATAPAGTTGNGSYIYYRGGLLVEGTTSSVTGPWGRQTTPYYSFRGPGTINAENGVFDNGVRLNDHVFDRAFDGAVKPSDAHTFGDARNLSIDEMARFTRYNRHLPTMKGRDSWHKEGGFSLGDLTNQLWTTTETQALYVTELNDRLDVIELLTNERPLAPAELQLAKQQLCGMAAYTEAEKAALVKNLESRTVTTNQR